MSHKMEERKIQPLPTSLGPLWGFGSFMPWARGKPNGWGEGRYGQRGSGMEGQSTWQASRLRGAGLAGHRAWEPE